MIDLEWTVVVPSSIALISLAVSLLVAARNWRYSDTSVRYISRNQYMNALFDIDRQLINRPELWAIYDNHPMASLRLNDAESKARREAFLHFHLNLFETVFIDYNKILVRTQNDKEFWQSWDTWIRRFLENSSEARVLFTETMWKGIYTASFEAYVDKLIANINAHPPNTPSSVGDALKIAVKPSPIASGGEPNPLMQPTGRERPAAD